MLLRAAQDADDVSAGLQVFLDHIPQRETDLEGCIDELVALSAALREIAEEHPGYDRINPRLTTDVELCIRSLGLTLRKVRAMFGETRHVKYSGERPYRRAWEDLDNHFVTQGNGPSLVSRLETYDIFIQSILSSLKGPNREYVDTAAILQNRRRISLLLQRQEPIEEAFAGMSFNSSSGWPPPRPPSRPQFPNVRTHSYVSHSANMSPVWSEGSDDFVFPPVPDPPFGPISPTMSNSTNNTWTSNSSASRSPISHWATKIFDHKHPRTPLLMPGEQIQCFGRPESPAIVQRLAAENFIEVTRLPLDGASFYVRLYWRPADHRARILCTRKDSAGLTTHYCIPLTALKLNRKNSTLILWRLDRGNNEFNMWATLTFQFYEPLVLFYCAFTAMKSQDHARFPDILQDRYHKKKNSEEKEEFSGEIKDDDFLHALRIYRDKDSGCLRLEARARRGVYTETPIWAAFVTKAMLRQSWIKVANSKTLQLAELHPYVFCPGYSPPSSKSGKFKLQFTTSKDAMYFVEVVNALAAAQ